MDTEIIFVDAGICQTAAHATAVVMMFLKTLKPSGGRSSGSGFKENSLNPKILLVVFFVLCKKKPDSTTDLSNLVLSLAFAAKWEVGFGVKKEI